MNKYSEGYMESLKRALSGYFKNLDAPRPGVGPSMFPVPNHEQLEQEAKQMQEGIPARAKRMYSHQP